MFVENKCETLMDLRFSVGQWLLFEATMNCVKRNPTQESKYGQMLYSPGMSSLLLSRACVGDGMEAVQEWFILVAIV